jgi:predicted lipoprotein with Yx(FWY)xxD motif
MKKTNLMCALLASLTLAACAGGGMYAAAPAKVMDGALTGANGMTLYTFDKDAAGSGKSLCKGPCATNWPPLFAMDSDMASGDYSIVMRDDGKKQWAFKGKPLYYWNKDQKPGDRTGDGFNNVWHTAKP